MLAYLTSYSVLQNVIAVDLIHYEGRADLDILRVLGKTKVRRAMCFDVTNLQAKVTLRWASFVEGRFSILPFAHFSFAPFAFATSKSFSTAFAFALRFPFSSFHTMTTGEESSSSLSFASKTSLARKLVRRLPFITSLHLVRVGDVFVDAILRSAWRKT